MDNTQKLLLVIEAVENARAAVNAAKAALAHLKAAGVETSRGLSHAFGEMRLRFAATMGDMRRRAAQGFRDIGAAARAGMMAVRAALSSVMGPLSLVMGMFGLAGGIGGAAGVGIFGKMGLEANAFKESTVASFEAMLKSRDAAEALYVQMQKFADWSPFDEDEVMAAAKLLKAFGFDTERTLMVVGNASKAMNVEISQVIGVLQKAKAGLFDTMEFGLVGVTREDLQARGVKFTKGGEPKERERIFAAVYDTLETKHRGLMEKMAGGWDAVTSTALSNLKRIAREVTGGLFDSVKTALTTLNETFSKVVGSERGKKILEGLAVPFNMVGRALEMLAEQAEPFVAWLEKVANKDEVQEFLVRVIALVDTLIHRLASFVGIDLGSLFSGDPAKFWDNLWKSIQQVVSAVFGVGRVWEEFTTITKGYIQDLRDAIHDLVDGIANRFKFVGDLVVSVWQHVVEQVTGQFRLIGLAVETQLLHVQDFANSIRLAILGVRESLASLNPWGGAERARIQAERERVFGEGMGIRERLGQIPQERAELERALRQRGLDDVFRGADQRAQERDQALNRRIWDREQGQDAADPDRRRPFWDRIGRAWRGDRPQDRGPGAGAEGAFWREWGGRAHAWRDRFFGPGKAAGDELPPRHDFGPDWARPPARAAVVPTGPTEDDIERMREALKTLKSKVDAGLEEPDALFAAMETVSEALRQHAAGLDANTKEGQAAWGAYFDSLNDLKKAVEAETDRMLKFGKTRTSVVEAFVGLFPQHQQGRMEKQLLGPMLKMQRDQLMEALRENGDADPQREQELLADLLGVSKKFGELGGKDPFGGRFGGKNDALAFFYGQDREFLQGLVLNGGGEALRLADPMERTAANTARIADLLERFGSAGVATGYQPDMVVTIDGNTIKAVARQAWAEDYQRSTARSPRARR